MATINFRIVYRLKKETPHPSAITPPRSPVHPAPGDQAPVFCLRGFARSGHSTDTTLGAPVRLTFFA